MSQLALLQEHLFGQKGIQAINFKIHPGSSRDVTVEDMAENVLSSISNLENAEIVTDFSEDDND